MGFRVKIQKPSGTKGGKGGGGGTPPPPPTETAALYVDPSYSGGTRNGTDSNPWQSLSDTATNTPWDVINAALASGPVSVYFTARPASSDTDQTSTTVIQLLRTDTSSNLLTLDGMSKYNTNASTPSWASYGGSSRFSITNSLPLSTSNRSSPFPDRNYITVRGFKLAGNGNSKVVEIAGAAYFTLEYNTVTHTVDATDGPGIIVLRPRLINQGAGGSYPTHITLQYNVVDKTFGEGIYVAGTTDDPPGTSDEATGDDILIQYNTITDAGYRGGQGDGIDIKDGNTNLRLIGNSVIYSAGYPGSSDISGGITVSSCTLIADNYIENSPKAGISTSGAWDNHFGRDGMVIRNNVIVKSGSSGISLVGGSSSTYKWTNTKLYNNTIYKMLDNGIGIAALHDNVTLKNNIVWKDAADNDDYVLNAVAGVIAVHDHNLFYAAQNANHAVSVGGSTFANSAITSYEATALAQDPVVVSQSSPYASVNFKLQTSSPCKNTGTAVATFNTDKDGVSRPQGADWDMGAYEFV